MTTSIQQLFDLEGRTPLVTGGPRGPGIQIAEALGEAGAKILLTHPRTGQLLVADEFGLDLGRTK